MKLFSLKRFLRNLGRILNWVPGKNGIRSNGLIRVGVGEYRVRGRFIVTFRVKCKNSF